MILAIYGPPDYSNIVQAFKELEPYERSARYVVARCDVAVEWATYFNKQIVFGEPDIVVSLYEDELI